MSIKPRVNALWAGLCALCLAGLALPVFSARANRIALPEPLSFAQSFGGFELMGGVCLAVAALLWLRRGRLAMVVLMIPALLALAGFGAMRVAATLGPYGRVAPNAALWLWLGVLVVALADAQARTVKLSHKALASLALFALTAGVFALGWLDHLSIMVEYLSRADRFGAELKTHLALALGAMAAAVALGVPLALALERRAGLAGPIMGALTAVQTVPSIALFGLMILPLSWLARHLPDGSGLSGIGFAPACLALTLYSLLPITATTRAGLRAVPASVRAAALGLGMDRAQIRARVTLPLAAPVILSGLRFVLVQNIGLATVGALIGAGGLGSFVFQGLSQGAMDLVLLGALPTVLLALACAALFDLLISVSKRRLE